MSCDRQADEGEGRGQSHVGQCECKHDRTATTHSRTCNVRMNCLFVYLFVSLVVCLLLLCFFVCVCVCLCVICILSNSPHCTALHCVCHASIVRTNFVRPSDFLFLHYDTRCSVTLSSLLQSSLLHRTMFNSGNR